MTRKDYELIAETIRTLRDLSLMSENNGAVAPRMIAQTFADRLATTNPRFDRATFLRACGVTS